MGTLIDSLRRLAETRPQATAFRFLGDGERETDSLSFGALDQRARGIACRLRALNAREQRVLVLLPQDLRFIVGFFGCLYASAVAVPMLAPRPRKPLSALRAIARNADPRVALTTREIRTYLEPELAADCPGLTWQCIEDIDDAPLERSPPLPSRDALAFLQYTSGSTGAPKGVMITHANLVSNIEAIGQAFAFSNTSIVGGWLPTYHDMGLIGLVLTPVHFGLPSVLMPPTAFLQKPARWLRMVSDYRISASGGPNFAYDLCVDRINSRELALDLSQWEVAFNGSEPVRWSTIERFSQTFQRYGFRPSSIYPCYGMAESTLFVTGVDAHMAVVTRDVKADDLRDNRVRTAITDENFVRLVACGRPGRGTRVEIIDPVTRARANRDEVGEIWVAGESVALGYFERPAETAENFCANLAPTGEGPFLRTGDLGFLHEGVLYIAGRLKDVIVIRGRNYHPQDLEATAEASSDALQKGAGTAFSIDVAEEARLVLVHELKRTSLHSDYRAVALDIQEAIATEHGLSVYWIALVKPGSIPNTSSGKVRRSACRDLLLRDALQMLYRFAGAGSASRFTIPSRPT